nr:5360_t:CDS:2 [Entrophospora candida]
MAYIHNYIHHDGKRLEKLFEIEQLVYCEQRWNFIQWVVQIVEPKDLMQNHGDHECFRPKTDFRYIRIIQQSWRNYEQRPESTATKIWNDLKADDYPDDKKFLA